MDRPGVVWGGWVVGTGGGHVSPQYQKMLPIASSTQLRVIIVLVGRYKGAFLSMVPAAAT